MKKIIIIAVSILLVMLVVIFFAKSFGGGQTTVTDTNTPNNSFPTNNTSQTPASNTIGTTPNNTLLVAPPDESHTTQTVNFGNDPALVVDPLNPGYYYLGYHYSNGISNSSASDDPPYLIEYISATQYFNISLLHEPLSQTRQQAEQYLMAHTGLRQAQMCQLKYMVSVPSSVNQIYAGASLGFSFCPGAVQL